MIAGSYANLLHVAHQEHEKALRKLKETGGELVPCPACGGSGADRHFLFSHAPLPCFVCEKAGYMTKEDFAAYAGSEKEKRFLGRQERERKGAIILLWLYGSLVAGLVLSTLWTLVRLFLGH